jgi:hypothetical protein
LSMKPWIGRKTIHALKTKRNEFRCMPINITKSVKEWTDTFTTHNYLTVVVWMFHMFHK